MASSNDGSDVDFDFFEDNSEKNNHPAHQDSSAISVTVSKSQSKASTVSNSDNPRSRSTATTSPSTSSKSPRRTRSHSSASSRSSRLSEAASFSKSESPSKTSSSNESLSSHFSCARYSKSSRSTSEESSSRRDAAVKKEYYSASSSESDVTDVSPLHSPHGKKPLAAKQLDSDEEKDSYEHESQPRSRPPSGKKSQGASSGDTINMRLLMEVLEMENRASEGRFERNKKVDFMIGNIQSRKNYSFPNDTVDDIDRENQRLLQRIMQFRSEKEKLRKQYERKVVTTRRKPVMTSAALNRKREQERIDRENLALLKRLQTTKATKTLRRNDLLDEYCGKTIAGQSVAAAHCARPKSAGTFYMPNGFEYGEVEEEADQVEYMRERRGRPNSATVVLQQDSGAAAASPASLSGRRRPTSAMALTSDKRTRSRPASSTHLPVDDYGSGSNVEQNSRSLVSLQSRHSDAGRRSSRSGRSAAAASAQ